MHIHVRNTINAIIIVCGTARSVCIIVYVAAKGLIYDYEGPESYLLARKSRGGLSREPVDVIYLCKLSERCLRTAQAQKDIMSRRNVLQYLTASILSSVTRTDVLSVLRQHAFDQCPEDNQVVMLTKVVVLQYLKIRLHHIVTLHNESRAQWRARHSD